MQRSAVRPSPIFLGLLALTVGAGFLAALGGETAARAGVFLLVLGGWAVSLCLHEFGHALVAYRGGDWSVQSKGYLTLNPARYTDPVLSLLLPILFLAIGGIPLPGGAVWINHGSLRSRGIESWVSLAGPLTNLVIGIVLAVVVGTAGPSDAAMVTDYFTGDTTANALWAGLAFLALLQLSAFILNILPVPGLDGWGAIQPFLSYEARAFGAKARQWAPLILFAVLIGVPGASGVFWDVVESLFGAVGGNEVAAAIGNELFFFWR
ncbi:site-2 protease family protein [Actinokineospora bangkokensis]|uniref:Site-2 protease family protein n=1 Tax=Actinokineospora bangkokensis TaxID=1193682 RepID=A0A1Q9LEG9_9PSEU|nr:site-2 protease family protein [Actinokineospora bangkokensis]OLR90430.1 site-2 protease family protein [Actinokineospora bangkokensis]